MARHNSGRPSAWLLLAGAIALTGTLASCGGDRKSTLAQAFGYHCEVHSGRVADTLCGKSSADGAKVSRYCYKSIADPNCFDRPDPQNNNQLGSSGY